MYSVTQEILYIVGILEANGPNFHVLTPCGFFRSEDASKKKKSIKNQRIVQNSLHLSFVPSRFDWPTRRLQSDAKNGRTSEGIECGGACQSGRLGDHTDN